MALEEPLRPGFPRWQPLGQLPGGLARALRARLAKLPVDERRDGGLPKVERQVGGPTVREQREQHGIYVGGRARRTPSRSSQVEHGSAEELDRRVAPRAQGQRLEHGHGVELDAQVTSGETEVFSRALEQREIRELVGLATPAMKDPGGVERAEKGVGLVERRPIFGDAVGGRPAQRRVGLGQKLPGVVQELRHRDGRKVTGVAVRHPDRPTDHRTDRLLVVRRYAIESL